MLFGISKEKNAAGVGTHAYCKDTAGNVFGILQPPAK
jgi:predicted enzyme related to lactoylglutathione lyase